MIIDEETLPAENSEACQSTKRLESFSLPFMSLEALDRHRKVVAPHVDSFNHFINVTLKTMIRHIRSQKAVILDSKRGVQFWIDEVMLGYPKTSTNIPLLPRECRERKLSYVAPLIAKFCFQIDDEEVCKFNRSIGSIPIMVSSNRCRLEKLNQLQMTRAGEEANELGGYFIVNGIERVIRLLIATKKNLFLAIKRPTFRQRGNQYSDKAVQMRCIRPSDQWAKTVFLHYLVNCDVTLRVSIRKQEFLFPAIIILKCFKNTSDAEIYDRITNNGHDTELCPIVESMLRSGRNFLKSQNVESNQLVSFLGKMFSDTLRLSDTSTDEDIGHYLLDNYLFIHLSGNDNDDDDDKYYILIQMIKKLLYFALDRISPDSTDVISNQELLLPGNLFGCFVEEKIDEAMSIMKKILETSAIGGKSGKMLTLKFFQDDLVDKAFGKKFSHHFTYFLATGNLNSSSGLDQSQFSGFTIVAERINYFRFLSHFQSVHRGQFFTQVRTTTVRKLTPETWGFMCPVHTPDGAPCGLLNHLAAGCVVCMDDDDDGLNEGEVKRLLDLDIMLPQPSSSAHPVFYNGKWLGDTSLNLNDAGELLRRNKKKEEICVLSNLNLSSGGDEMINLSLKIWQGIWIFSDTCSGRMIRKVASSSSSSDPVIVWIGPLEQINLGIGISKSSTADPYFKYHELNPSHILSHVASLTPYSDFNQSPRNMYQCQMGKQTMGFPLYTYSSRSDKMFRLYFPQSPVVKTDSYTDFEMDEYASGTNAVIAVMSYTGFDMEDAMIINKASYERGFAHGCVYKTETLDLPKLFNTKTAYFKNIIEPGSRVEYGEELYVAGEEGNDHIERIGKHKEVDAAYVDQVRVWRSEEGSDNLMSKASITLRYPRNPIVGDKFSSRHGQKGVLSMLWKTEDMPFTGQGIVPDIIINPHAFPSRMTIGMLIESMAGKVGCLNGQFQNGTPFKPHGGDGDTVGYFGKQLLTSGYSYYGNECLYSGVTGKAFPADVFIGVVYYQRLRHMVSDKFQVRSTGPVNPLTHQPIKGRKKHGGIRFGEMERDSLLAHGVAFAIKDRLMNSSDKSLAHVCRKCGSLLGPQKRRNTLNGSNNIAKSSMYGWACRFCDVVDDGGEAVVQRSRSNVEIIELPFVYRYLANELAAMGIKLKFKLN